MNRDRATEILDACQGKRIAVVGDVMLDRYIGGKASRLSQEAPVPIVAVDDVHDVPGGAANVARNVIALGSNAAAFGIVGGDPAGSRLRDMMESMGADTAGMLSSDARRTTEKTRVLANRQQVARIDVEDTHTLSNEEETELAGAISGAIDAGSFSAVVIEDYAKGVITSTLTNAICERAHAAGIPVTLDPHPGNAMDARGLTAMTPNRAEAMLLAGVFDSKPSADPLEDQALTKAAAILAERYGVQYLLITLGPQGMILFRDGASPHHIETKAQEVFDVSGAGDTVIATLTLALAVGAPIEDAADLANHAAGVVVGKMGTAVVSREELLASFDR